MLFAKGIGAKGPSYNGDFAGLVRLAVSDLGGATECRRGRRARGPRQLARDEPRRAQVRIVRALCGDQRAALERLADDVPGLARRRAPPADAEAFALAERVVHDAGVLADRLALGRLDRARL